jgi:hypothetical protein
VNEFELVARHEAGHIAMALATGCRPYGATVGGLPRPLLGCVRCSRLARTEDNLHAHALISLAGWIGEGQEPPAWRACPHASTDARHAVLYTENLAVYYGMDPERLYGELVTEAYRKASQRVYQLLEASFFTALMRCPTLGTTEISRSCGAIINALNAKEQLHVA